MNALINFLGKLGEELVRLLPAFFAYLAGKKEKEHDFEKSLNEVLAEDARDWADRPRDDDDFNKRLRDLAESKRKNRT